MGIKKFALALDASARITSITYAALAPVKMINAGTVVLVESKPDGPYGEYKWIDGEYIHDPLPQPAPEPAQASLEERLSATESAVMVMMDMMAMGMGGDTNV